MVLHRLKERIVKQVLSHNLFSNFYPLLPFMRLETEAACTKMLPNYLLKKRQILTRQPSAALGNCAFNWNQKSSVICMLKMNVFH